MDRLMPDSKRTKKEDAGFLQSIALKTSNLVKRTFDIIVAFFGLILLSPLLALAAVLIKRDSPGPVFYQATRMGRNGSVFKMLKFRTMYETPRSYKGLRITCKDDNRITPLGKWLRDTKMNEIPQLWNVLIGDMSLVGPRPEDPSIAKTWPRKIARELLSVRPGITSPASVVYRNEENMLHAGDVMRKYLHELSPDKMRLDQLYVRYRTFWLDVDVILWTALLLIPKIRTFSLPEQLLFVGPVSRLIQRYVIWFVWDFLIVLGSIGVMGFAVRLFGPLDLGLTRAIKMALGASLFYSVAGIVLRINQINWPKATSWELSRLWTNWLIVTLGLTAIHYLLGFRSLRTFGIILGTSIISLSGIAFVHYRGRLIDGILSRLSNRRLNSLITRERVIIVGSGRTAEHLAWLMEHPTYSKKFHLVGFIDDDLWLQGMTVYGAKVIGRIHDIPRVIQKYDVGVIILADFQIAAHQYQEFHDLAAFQPARVVVAPDIFGSLGALGQTPSSEEYISEMNDFQCQHCLARYDAWKHAGAHISQRLPIDHSD